MVKKRTNKRTTKQTGGLFFLPALAGAFGASKLFGGVHDPTIKKIPGKYYIASL